MMKTLMAVAGWQVALVAMASLTPYPGSSAICRDQNTDIARSCTAIASTMPHRVTAQNAGVRFHAVMLPVETEKFIARGFCDDGTLVLWQPGQNEFVYLYRSDGTLNKVATPEGYLESYSVLVGTGGLPECKVKTATSAVAIMVWDQNGWTQVSPKGMYTCERFLRNARGTTVAVGRQKRGDPAQSFVTIGGVTKVVKDAEGKVLNVFELGNDNSILTGRMNPKDGNQMEWRLDGKIIEVVPTPPYSPYGVSSRQADHEVTFSPLYGRPDAEGATCLVARQGELVTIVGPSNTPIEHLKSGKAGWYAGVEISNDKRQRAVVSIADKAAYVDDVVTNVSELKRSHGFQGQFYMVFAVGHQGQLATSGSIRMPSGSHRTWFLLTPIQPVPSS